MRFLLKGDQHIITQIKDNGLSYEHQKSSLRKLLLLEQKNFCAYTEWYFEETASPEIEHFDNRKKGTLQDGYHNWYVVKRWSNAHKPDISNYLPIMEPSNEAVFTKIEYSGNQFIVKDKTDSDYLKLDNLLKLIGCNKIEVAIDRQNHIDKLKTIMELYETKEDFKNNYLRNNKHDLSFITALQHELDLDLTDLI